MHHDAPTVPEGRARLCFKPVHIKPPSAPFIGTEFVKNPDPVIKS